MPTRTHYNLFSLILTAFCCGVVVSGCNQPEKTTQTSSDAQHATMQKPDESVSPENVTINTADGWKLHALLFKPEGASNSAVILLHQRGGSSSDWNQLSTAIVKKGITALAIDQRGAGSSTEGTGGKGDNAPWDTSQDIAAAIKYLAPISHIGLVGASYGANNALIYAASHPDQISGVVLYSPGLDYNGLKTEEPAKKWKGFLRIYHDKGDSVAGDSPQSIDKLSKSPAPRLFLTEGDRHGTALLESSMTTQNGPVTSFLESIFK